MGPIMQAATGAGALAMFRESPASLVFIGADIGIVNAALLTRKLRGLSVDRALRLIGITDGRESAATRALFDDVMTRTLVPDMHRAEIRRFVEAAAQPLDVPTVVDNVRVPADQPDLASAVAPA
jgi:hypothetical protein